MDISLGECHDISVCPGIQCLGVTLAVICREIDSHRVMEVELVLKDDELHTLFIGEQVSSRVVFRMEQACEDVVFELRNELLCGNQWLAASPC